LFWRAVAANQKYGSPNAEDAAGLGLHMCLMSLRKHYNAIKPQKVAVAFEGKQNWRKDYTKSEECYPSGYTREIVFSTLTWPFSLMSSRISKRWFVNILIS
jgi:hypothetical protein